MKLLDHLSNEDLTDVLLDSDHRYLKRTLSSLPGSLRASADHPDAFWERQQIQIQRRIRGSAHRPARIVAAWASAFAMISLAALLLFTSPTQNSSSVDTVSDQDLLVAVEQVLQNDVPVALEPAALLADEINQGTQSSSRSKRNLQGEHNESQ